ncbi:formin-like protein 20 [Schistocerca piceifrons]|uniref:formin-like protein 20 n=1 Tax=Schistocerca piceifrons TaxID=274613 RepID=UPI001F5E6ED5|nr:formin-like protein 20 [Schistocerca piceifrons]
MGATPRWISAPCSRRLQPDAARRRAGGGVTQSAAEAGADFPERVLAFPGGRHAPLRKTPPSPTAVCAGGSTPAGPCRGPRTHQPPPPPPPPPGANSSSHDGAQLRRKPVARPPPPATAHSAPAPINSGRFASRGTGPPPTTSHLDASSPWPPQQAYSLPCDFTFCTVEVRRELFTNSL